MTRREKELERALAGFEHTGDAELDAMLDQADRLTAAFAAGTPRQPAGRTLFIEGVAARKQSFLSSLAVPAMAVAALMVFIAMIGRSALPGDTLYPVRNVLRSAGLAEAPTDDIERELDDAALLVARAEASRDQGHRVVERFAVAALMSLGRAESYLDEVGATDRVRYEARIEALRTRAAALIRIGDDVGDGSSGSGRSGSGDSDDDSSGSGSGDSDDDDSDDDDSDDDASDDDSSGSGSGDSDDRDSDDDSSGSGSGDSDDDDELEELDDDAKDEERDDRDDLTDSEED